ncbi:MAG: GTPase, partial [Bacteroidota bacterium]
QLSESFAWGNVVKSGVPTVIAGKPNAGKSTLLNALLNEEKAIVSDMPGTTRDVIEDEITLEGIKFRFIDTAGLRETTDKVEQIGVSRTREQMQKAAVVLYLYDAATFTLEEAKEVHEELKPLNVPFLLVANQIDKTNGEIPESLANFTDLGISALLKTDLETLKSHLLELVQTHNVGSDEVVTNLRHYESLQLATKSLEEVLAGLEGGLTGDLVSLDLRTALDHIGTITGEVVTDEVLGTIFSRFGIGK